VQLLLSLPQLTLISGISDKVRAEIASKKAEAIKHLQKKKRRNESRQVECEKHKKQENHNRDLMSTPEKTKKRNIVEVEEAEKRTKVKDKNRMDKMAINS